MSQTIDGVLLTEISEGLESLLRLFGVDDSIKDILIELAPTQAAMDMGSKFGSKMFDMWWNDDGLYATLFALAAIYIFLRVLMFRDERQELLDRFGMSYLRLQDDHRLMDLSLFSGVKSKLSPTAGMTAEWLVNSAFMPIIYLSFAWISSKASMILLFNKGAVSAFIDAMFNSPILTLLHLKTALVAIEVTFGVSVLIMWAGIYFYPFLEAARIFDKGIGESLLGIFHVNYFVIPGMIVLFDLGLILSNADHAFSAEAVYTLAIFTGPLLWAGGTMWAYTKAGAKVAAQLILFKAAALKIPAGILQAAAATGLVNTNAAGELPTNYQPVTNKFVRPAT